MNIASYSSLTSPLEAYRAASGLTNSAAAPRQLDAQSQAPDNELRKTFDTFVGEAFYGQMLKSMRSSVGKPAYFHGGRSEEIFQGQLDQILSQEMTKASASDLTGPMFELFQLTRS